MALTSGFWLDKSLEEMNREEWEALCDGCGLCCLHKLEDIDTGELVYTGIVCRHYDQTNARCTCYDTRHEKVPDCLVLTPELVATLDWLPETCAYRPRPRTRAGRVVNEDDVHPHDWAQAWLEAREAAEEE